jgi:hypothetical protein
MSGKRPDKKNRGSDSPKRGERVVFLLIASVGVPTLAVAAWAWTLQLNPHLAENALSAWVRVGINSLKVLSLSDFPKDGDVRPDVAQLLSYAYMGGAIFLLFVGNGILFLALADRSTEFLLARWKKHDVVIGSGPAAKEYPQYNQRKSIHVAEGLKTRGGRSASLARGENLERQLRRAGAARAHQIVVDEGADADTWETAQDIARLLPTVSVAAYIADAWTQERLTRSAPDVQLRTFSYASGVARHVMLAHPPYMLARRYKADAQHILVIGFGSVGQSLVREFLATSVSTNPEPMKATVIDKGDMAGLEAEFSRRMPALKDYADIACLHGDLKTPSKELEQILASRHAQSPICAIYIAVDVRSQPLGFAFLVRDYAYALGIWAPIFVCAQHGAGLPNVTQGVGNVGTPSPDQEQARQNNPPADQPRLANRSLTAFGSWTNALDGAGLFEEPAPDEMARCVHEDYLENLPPGEARVEWKDLPDDFRMANRRTISHIRAKLEAAGYDLDKWLEQGPIDKPASHSLPCAPEFANHLSDEQKEMLARLEHNRWLIDRALTGWKYGDRDNDAHTHPQMLPWEHQQLKEGSRQYCRNSIRLALNLVSGRSPRTRGSLRRLKD